LSGRGIPADPQQALKWFKKAAKKKDRLALFHLGYIHDNCNCGFSNDPALAASWYQKAAEVGHPAAENNLGVLYAKGAGVPQDMAKAFFYFTRSAEHDNPDAYWALYRFHWQGLGTPVDRVKALSWLMLAAEESPKNSKMAAELAARREETDKADIEAASRIAAAWRAVHTHDSIQATRFEFGIIPADGPADR
jgi:TPR repeat protein